MNRRPTLYKDIQYITVKLFERYWNMYGRSKMYDYFDIDDFLYALNTKWDYTMKSRSRKEKKFEKSKHQNLILIYRPMEKITTKTTICKGFKREAPVQFYTKNI